jgi:hypothetical protein
VIEMLWYVLLITVWKESLNIYGQNSTNINKINNLSSQVVEHKIYHDIWQEWLWYADLCLHVNEEHLRVYRINKKMQAQYIYCFKTCTIDIVIMKLKFYTNECPRVHGVRRW